MTLIRVFTACYVTCIFLSEALLHGRTSLNSFRFRVHYENMPMQYSVIFHGRKNDNFHINCDIFLIFAQNIDCGYTEAVLTSTPNLCFRAKIRKLYIPR